MAKQKSAGDLRRKVLQAFSLALVLPTLLSAHLVAKAALPQTAAVDSAIPQTALVQPAHLNALLNSPGKPLILQIGSHTLFTEAHIPGSEYAGAAATPAGLAMLRARVADVSKTAPIVLYCGCCPWNRCPNIRPAYKELRALGFTDVKVLYLARNFGADWADMGFPVEREQ